MTRKSGSAGVASSHTTTYHLRFVQIPQMTGGLTRTELQS